MNVAAPILDVLSREPQRLAIQEPSGRRVSHGDLLRRTIALARYLQQEGLAPGDGVVLQVQLMVLTLVMWKMLFVLHLQEV